MRFTTSMRGVAVAGASVLTLAACSGEGAESGDEVAAPAPTEFGSEMQKLYDQAIESGETVVAAYGPPGAINEEVAEDFSRSFPEITIKFEYLFGAELQSRVAAEFETGEPEVDVLLSGAIDNDSFRESGYLEPYVPETAASLPEEYQEDAWASPILVVLGPMYNTTTMSSDEVPTNWADLVDPAMKGRLGTSDPTVPATASFMIGAALREGIVDETWVQDLGKLNPMIYPSQTASVQSVASGQSDMTLLASYNNVQAAKEDGAPVEFAQLEEGTFAWPQSVALVAKASASAAAKLFIAWLYSEAGQESVASVGLQGTMPDAPRPDGLEDASYFTYPHADVLAEYDDYTRIIDAAM